jgi:hypothetical protein
MRQRQKKKYILQGVGRKGEGSEIFNYNLKTLLAYQKKQDYSGWWDRRHFGLTIMVSCGVPDKIKE